jgi:hypothetical protein
MSLTVVETIAVALYDRLEAMVGSDDYQTEVASVIRPARNGGDFNIEHLQIVIRQGLDEIVDELSYPGNPPAIAHRQTFNLRCHVLLSERDTDSVESTVNTFQADVIKCLTTGTTWYQFGGYAVDTNIGAVEPINEDGGIDGFNLPVYVTYRVDENNPYNVRT